MRRLPRTSASPHFTSEVMRRVAARETARPRAVWRFAAALAMMLCAAVLLFEAHAAQARQQRLAELRAEHQRIEAELQQVKEIAEDPRPVVVLENDDTRVIVPVSDHAGTTTSSIVY